MIRFTSSVGGKCKIRTEKSKETQRRLPVLYVLAKLGLLIVELFAVKSPQYANKYENTPSFAASLVWGSGYKFEVFLA